MQASSLDCIGRPFEWLACRVRTCGIMLEEFICANSEASILLGNDEPYPQRTPVERTKVARLTNVDLFYFDHSCCRSFSTLLYCTTKLRFSFHFLSHCVTVASGQQVLSSAGESSSGIASHMRYRARPHQAPVAIQEFAATGTNDRSSSSRTLYHVFSDVSGVLSRYKGSYCPQSSSGSSQIHNSELLSMIRTNSIHHARGS